MSGIQILLALSMTVQSIIEFSAIKTLKYAIKDLSIYLAIKTNRSKTHHQVSGEFQHSNNLVLITLHLHSIQINHLLIWVPPLQSQLPGLMSGQIQAWVVGLQFPAVGRDCNHCHTPVNDNSKCNSTGSSTGTFHSAASSSKLVWEPGGDEQPRAVCGCTLLWEVNHSRGLILLCFSPGSLVMMV